VKILIVGVGHGDEQFSMSQYGKLMRKIYINNKYDVTECSAPFLFRRLIDNKWSAYVDWMFFFPVWLLLNAWQYDVVHIIDHSKGFLSFFCVRAKTIVTCHDMIAIRSAYGRNDIELSLLGKALQRYCLVGMEFSDTVVCVSDTTFGEYLKYSKSSNAVVILSALNEPFTIVAKELARDKLASVGVMEKDQFVFHIGSNLDRKNRQGVIKSFALSDFSQEGYLIFAGERLLPKTKDLVRSLGIENKVIDLGRVNFELLNALYTRSKVFLFPSYSEGFGWPVIEAQASGAAVICSDRESLAEVGAIGTIQVDPDDHKMMAKRIDDITFDQDFADEVIKAGIINLSRFSVENMSVSYSRVVGELG